MSGYIIYGDILLALNFFCDFFLLWAAGRVLRRKILLLRITAAAGGKTRLFACAAEDAPVVGELRPAFRQLRIAALRVD